MQAVYEYLQDEDMGRYLEGANGRPTMSDVENIIARHSQTDWSQRGVWAITSDDVAVGAVSLNFLKLRQVAEIGYSVKKPFWGQGITAEACEAVVDALFETHPELRRIQAGIHPLNQGSIRVAEKLGMRYEGTLRAYSYVKGAVADEVIYALLRPEDDA